MTYLSARKIPQLGLLALLGVILARPAGAAQADTVQLYRAAQRAEAQYEYAARHLAPWSTNARYPGPCDEHVGRFCIYFDAGRDALPAEPARIAESRRKALEKIYAAYRRNPARIKSVFPLIRLLLEDHRPADAQRVAAEFAAATSDVANARMLAVLTSYAASDIVAAEHALPEWLAAVDTVQRRRLEDINWLLAPRERQRYRRLSGPERSRYDSIFWRYADALYLTDGNETRTEHFARHAESKLIAAAPVVMGGSSWGSDMAQLTIRFGSIKARTRERRTGLGSSELHIIEHWDPEQVIFAPPEIDTVLNVRARPAGGWPMDTVRSVSGHAPSTIRRMLPLEHQASVFRENGGYVLRVDGRVVADTIASGNARVRQGLFVLSDSLIEVSRVVSNGVARKDTFLFAAESPLPRAAAFYSAEILESETRLAARARFRFEWPQADRGLELSDILIAQPFTAGQLPTNRTDPRLVPRPDLLIPAGQPFGAYAEVNLGRDARDSVRVDLELIAIDGRPALLRAARWIGKRFGLSEDTPPNQLSWLAEIDADGPAPIAITVDAGRLKAGRYVIELSVADVVAGGRRATARREILIVD